MRIDCLNDDEQKIADLDYSSEDAQILIKEFTILLNQVSNNYENMIVDLESSYKKEIDELRETCKLYQKQMNNNSIYNPIYLRIHKLYFVLKKKIKSFIKIFVRLMFKIAKKVVVFLGIKNMLKNTFLFKKLYKSGLIDKLANRKV